MSARFRRLPRAALAGALLFLGPWQVLCAQEEPPPPAEPPAGAAARPGGATDGHKPAMIATGRYLFVIHGDRLLQFDVDTLELRRSVSLAAAGGRAAGPGEPFRVSEVDEPAEFEEIGAAGAAPPPVALDPAAVLMGLKWLADHQDPDGKWDADGFMKHDTVGLPCDGPGNAVHDVGVTGLALLAFLGDGSTLTEGPWRANIKRAVDWLTTQQQHNGLFGTNAASDFVYDHAIATLAVARAWRRSGFAPLREPVQRAVNYLEMHRNPYAVWRYQPRDNDNDTSVTTWAVLACREADEGGLEVNRNALRLAQVWYDQVTDAKGRTGYTKAGEPSSRHPGDHARRFPPEAGEAMTAAGLYARLATGQTPAKKPVMEVSARLLLRKPPSADKGAIDSYYWFMGSRALRRMGGDWWRAWQRHLPAAIEARQRRDGNFAGSWDPVGVWGEDGGRVYTTAMNTMALQPAPGDPDHGDGGAGEGRGDGARRGPRIR